MSKWLAQAEARRLQDYLANKAAALVAEAGNILAKGDASAQIDAEEKVEEARKVRYAVELLDKMKEKEYEWRETDMSPKPQTHM